MSLTENSDQVFLPGGCNRTQNLRFGPYTIILRHARIQQTLSEGAQFCCFIFLVDVGVGCSGGRIQIPL